MTKLITDEQCAQLLANGRQFLEQENFDPAPVVKLFTPDAGATRLLTATVRGGSVSWDFGVRRGTSIA